MTQIRAAQLSDAETAVALLYSAYTHTPVTFPLQEAAQSGWIAHLQRFFLQEANRFSYQNILVAEQRSVVAGLVLSFGGRDEAPLNAAVGPWLEHEAQDDEWYIDALAVFKGWTRQGIGTRLLEAAELQARQHHYPNIALNVAEGNAQALALYTQLHYVVTEHTVLYDHPHVRMVKVLER